MEDIFDQLREKLHEETFDIGEWRNEMRLLINAARNERDFYKGCLINVDCGESPAGVLDWNRLWEIALWYRELGGNIHKVDDVCFPIDGDWKELSGITLFGPAFHNLTEAIRDKIIAGIKETLDEKEANEVVTWISDNWSPDDNYCAASFNFEPFDYAWCSNMNLGEAVEHIVNEFLMTSDAIDYKLNQGEENEN